VTSREFGERLSKRLGNGPDSIPLAPAVLAQLEAYYHLLARWNETINLTSLPLQEWNDQAVDRLLVEPLLAARYVPESAIPWFDFGSGGGSPALPLKILRPLSQLTMVESKSRKAAFLREAVRSLQLPSAIVHTGRFEDLAARPEMRGVAQLVTVRAVKVDRPLFDAASTLLAASGALFLFTSADALAQPLAGFEVAETAQLSAQPGSQLVILRRL
jgi:16S rRNA (guanine527-N7)-methyltransferase